MDLLYDFCVTLVNLTTSMKVVECSNMCTHKQGTNEQAIQAHSP